MSYIFWKLCDQGRSWHWKNDVRSWFKAARNFFFTPDSNWTLIWHCLLLSFQQKGWEPNQSLASATPRSPLLLPPAAAVACRPYSLALLHLAFGLLALLWSTSHSFPQLSWRAFFFSDKFPSCVDTQLKSVFLWVGKYIGVGMYPQWAWYPQVLLDSD